MVPVEIFFLEMRYDMLNTLIGGEIVGFSHEQMLTIWMISGQCISYMYLSSLRHIQCIG